MVQKVMDRAQGHLKDKVSLRTSQKDRKLEIFVIVLLSFISSLIDLLDAGFHED